MAGEETRMVVNVDVPKLLEMLGINAEKRGREMWARCPYPCHVNDKEPSWSISVGGSNNGLNYCFGCGSSGNAAELVMEVVELSSYAAAIDWIKNKGLDVDEPSLPNLFLSVNDRRTSVKRLDKPRALIIEYSEWPSTAKRFAESRGLTIEQIDRWHIECAVDGKLSGRLWIPTYDAAGVLLNWNARTWCDDAQRYKSADGGGLSGALFGEARWPEIAERKRLKLVMCEGELNALACERAGAEHVAALGGASKYDGWKAMKIATWGKIVIATDPDAAGDKVASLVSQLDRFNGDGSVVRAALPRGVDCDDLWKRDPSLLVEVLNAI